MNVEILKSSLSDNFFFLIADDQGRAALIDPVDGEQAVEVVRQRGFELTHLLNTHFHPDHVAGNPDVMQAFPEALLVAGEGDAKAIDQQFRRGPKVRETVVGGDVVEVGGLSLEVLDTPGHTPGHISFLHGHHLFSGDTIFVAGAGNCRFGGDPGVLFATFRDVLRGLPDEMLIYPGHDYSARNAEFLLSIEPEHSEAQTVLEEAQEAHEAGRLMQTTLGREKTYNAFLRYDDPELLRALEQGQPQALAAAQAESSGPGEAVFRCVRSLRNQW